ncbi:MAG TPA: hypothetical protein VMU13_02605 [Candidatus Paceibacterota bacterium]|nr:hypothetical protein [Candidatus Paceibacterota bacterium]
MRSRVLLLVTVVLSLPIFVSAAAAATPTVTKANIAPGTDSTAAACINKLFQAQNQKNAAAGKPANSMTDGLKDNCTDETVTEDTNGKMTYQQTGREGNKNDVKDPLQCILNSCSASDCGKITLKVSIQGIPSQSPISKCSAQGEKFMSEFGTSAGAKDFALNAINQQAIQQVISSGDPTKTQGLLEAFGLPQDQAQELAQNHPADATTLLNALASGDQSQIASATQQVQTNTGITLNTDTLKDVTSLSPQQLSQNISSNGLLSAQQQANVSSIENAPSTFGQPTSSSGTSGNNIPGTLSPLCNQLGGCGNVCPSVTSYVCSTNNPGALTWASWEAKYGGQPCGQPNNATCFPNMESGIAAQGNLLTTGSKYFGSGNGTILSAFCGGYSDNCSAYATFISNKTGIPLNQTIDPNNAQQVGAIMMASSAFESGKGVIYTPDQLQTGLQAVYGGTIPTGTPGYNPSTIYGTNGGTQYSSPLSVIGNTAVPVVYSGTGSPFANVSSIYATPGLGSSPYYPYSPSSGYGGYTQPAQYVQPYTRPYTQPYTQPVQTAPVNQTSNPAITNNTSTASNTQTSTSSAKTGTAVAQLIVQPKTIAKGGAIVVSWTSAGTSAASPCIVSDNGTIIGNSNEGSKLITASSIGTLSFSLSCTAQGTGATVTSSGSVSVHS